MKPLTFGDVRQANVALPHYRNATGERSHSDGGSIGRCPLGAMASAANSAIGTGDASSAGGAGSAACAMGSGGAREAFSEGVDLREIWIHADRDLDQRYPRHGVGVAASCVGGITGIISLILFWAGTDRGR
jgi:hypothetical protein